MNRALLLRTVLMRFWRYKAKTLFMGLGITVGVIAIVLLQTAASGVRRAFGAYFEHAYPADCIVLIAGSGFMGGGAGRNNLKLADAETVASSLAIAKWDPAVFIGPRDIKHAGNSLQVGVAGYSEQAESVRGRSVREGEFFSADDVKSRANVALVGPTTAAKLFPGESPVGAEIFIDNLPFRVKGVLESAGVDPHGGDQDNVIEVPYTTLMDKINRATFISGANFITGDRSRVNEVKGEIAKIMREQHQIGPGEQDDFTLLTATLVQELLDRSFRTFNIFMPLIAGTVFLISAMVILSIMQISIKGRTPEIGLRKAVGASPGDLETQIILEVLMVSAAASVVGLLLAQIGINALAPVLAAKFGVKHLSAPIMVLVAAVGAAMATGLLGGIWPARRAAKLNPVEALR